MSSGIHQTTWSGAVIQTEGNIVWGDLSTIVLMYIPGIEASVSTNGTSIVTDTPLPSRLWPSTDRVISGLVLSGGEQVQGTYTIGTDGVIIANADNGFAVNGNGDNGLIFQGISYLK